MSPLGLQRLRQLAQANGFPLADLIRTKTETAMSRPCRIDQTLLNGKA
jgi:hypothetical protein